MKNTLIKKRMIIFAILFVIFCTFAIVVISKYGMNGDEKQQYRSAIDEYESIQLEIQEVSDRMFCVSPYYDEKELQHDSTGKFIFNNRYIKLRNESYFLYNKLFNIEFPKKYQQIYRQLVLLENIDYISCMMAFESSADLLLDEFKQYFPDDSIEKRYDKLEKQLYNEYYIPKDIDNSMYEQLYYRITTDWYDETKISSHSDYEKLHDLLYSDEFLNSLK